MSRTVVGFLYAAAASCCLGAGVGSIVHPLGPGNYLPTAAFALAVAVFARMAVRSYRKRGDAVSDAAEQEPAERGPETEAA